MIPQLIYLFLLLGGMLLSASQHGKQKKGKENFWKTLGVQIIIVGILYAGGFFNIIIDKFHCCK